MRLEDIAGVTISIHTTLAGCDARPLLEQDGACGISIHTALAGCDSNYAQQKPHTNKHYYI